MCHEIRLAGIYAVPRCTLFGMAGKVAVADQSELHHPSRLTNVNVQILFLARTPVRLPN